MGFYGVKIDEHWNITGFQTRPDEASDPTICFGCGTGITPLTSYRTTVTVGRAAKWIPDPQKRRDATGNVIEIMIYVPVTTKARHCRSCVGNLSPEQYQNRTGQTVGSFKDSENRTVRVHFESEPNQTLHGTAKADRKADRNENQSIVREFRLDAETTVYIPISDPFPAGVYQDKDGNITGAIPDKPDANSFGKFGFKRPKDYRKYIKG